MTDDLLQRLDKLIDSAQRQADYYRSLYEASQLNQTQQPITQVPIVKEESENLTAQQIFEISKNNPDKWNEILKKIGAQYQN